MRVVKCFKRCIILNYRKYQSLQFRLPILFVIFFIFFSYKIFFGENSTEFKNSENNIWFLRYNNLSNFQSNISEGTFKECTIDTPVLVAVISAPSHFSARRAIRNSWGKQLPKEWKLLFFVGITADKSQEEEIAKEENTFGDMILLNVKESYVNLTLKLYMTFWWVHQHCLHSGFLIKVDDDVYLSPYNLKHLMYCSSLAMDKFYEPLSLQNCENTWGISNIVGHFVDEKSRNYISYIVGGYVYKNAKPDRNPYSKWYLSKSLYSPDDLPDFLSGTAYFFSTNLLPYVLETVTKVPAINLEDLFYTGIVMKRELNLKISHIKGWNRFRPQWDDTCSYSKLVTAHGLSPEEIVSITEKVLNVGNSCTWLTSLFSFINEVISNFLPRYQ